MQNVIHYCRLEATASSRFTLQLLPLAICLVIQKERLQLIGFRFHALLATALSDIVRQN